MTARFVVAMIIMLMLTAELHGVLRVIRFVMSDACHTEREYPLDSGRGKKIEGLYCIRKNEA